MRYLARFLTLFTLAVGFMAAPARAEDKVTVFAAASLQEALTEAGDAFVAQGHAKPVLTFAASSALARQIEAGAPAGLFISADEQWMDYVSERGLLAPNTRTTFLGNHLVLVAPAAKPFTIAIKSGFPLAEILGTEKLALADPDSVPAGKYAKAALINLGVWSQVEGNVVPADNVRSALAFVERAEARAGVVYTTDALASKKVMVAGTFPDISHQPITYPLAVLKAHDTPEARSFRAFLLSNAAKTIFKARGFIVN